MKTKDWCQKSDFLNSEEFLRNWLLNLMGIQWKSRYSLKYCIYMSFSWETILEADKKKRKKKKIWKSKWRHQRRQSIIICEWHFFLLQFILIQIRNRKFIIKNVVVLAICSEILHLIGTFCSHNGWCFVRRYFDLHVLHFLLYRIRLIQLCIYII